MKEVFFSIDIETDGPSPVTNSMLSIGVAAFRPNGRLLGTFERNLLPQEGASQNLETMVWWESQPEAWAHLMIDRVPASLAMRDLEFWVHSFVGNPIAVCAPASFDYTFLYVYCTNLLGKSPFGFSCVDIRSFVMGGRGKKYDASGRSKWPKRWRDKRLPHTHKAIDDAVEQGLAFLKAREEFRLGHTDQGFRHDQLKKIEENFWSSVAMQRKASL